MSKLDDSSQEGPRILHAGKECEVYKIDQGLMGYGLMPVLPMPVFCSLTDARSYLLRLAYEYGSPDGEWYAGNGSGIKFHEDSNGFQISYADGSMGDVVRIREEQ